MKRLGIFGGSFDPVHVGHLWIGEAALETLGLERLDWIPTATQPLKPGGPVASAEDRLAMLRLALAGDSQHQIDDREVRRGEASFTVDTVEEIRGEHPEAKIVFIIGSDSLASIRKWKDPERLLRLAVPAVVRRGGESDIDFSVLNGLVDSDGIDNIRNHVIAMPVIEISSSDLRERIQSGRRIRYRTPRAVEALIDANGLYK